MDDFTVTVTGEEIPEESILLQRLQEALKRGNTHVNIINGYIVNTNSTVNLTIGPVLGEITANKAIVMIEVVGKTETIPITAKLYKGEEKGEPVDVLEKDVQAKRPAIFQSMCFTWYFRIESRIDLPRSYFLPLGFLSFSFEF